MKIYLSIFTFFLLSTTLFAQTKTLNVFAPSGLSMRESPKTSGQKIKSIPYGSQVIILDGNMLGEFVELQEFDGFKIQGYWKKVAFEQDTGFVFDGYLSDLPVCGSEQYSTEFFEDILNPISERYNLKYYPYETTEKTACGYEQKFEMGITIKEDECGEAGGQYEVYINNRSFQEVYNFVLPVFFKKNEEIKEMYNSKLQKIQIMPKDEGPGCYMTIERFGENGIKVSVYCGC